MTGFANAADSLANNGILNFDADSYITGAAPRYIGAPDAPMQLPLDRPLWTNPSQFGYGFNPRLASQPSSDAFVSRTPHQHKSSILPWAAGILGSLGLVTLAGLVYKDKKDVTPDKFVDGVKVPTDPGAKTTTKAVAETAKEKATTLLGKTKNIASSAWSKIKNFKVPTWGKVALGATAGLMVLYGGYKALSRPSIDTQRLPEYPKYPQG